jgi:hypothetical protein
MASKKANLTDPWYDCFARSGKICWLVFLGCQLLAEVKNEQQAINVVNAILSSREGVKGGLPG